MKQRIIQDDILLCEECKSAAEGDDVTIIDQNRARAVEAGLTRFAERGTLVGNYDDDTQRGIWGHSRMSCDCCHTSIAGKRYDYVLLASKGK